MISIPSIKNDLTVIKNGIMKDMNCVSNDIATVAKCDIKADANGLKRKRNVSFHPKVAVQYCRSHKTYSPAEKKDCWLNFDELKMMKRSSRMLAMEFSQVIHNPNNANKIPMSENGVDCLRGLEGRTTLGMAKRKKVKQTSRRAVLREQSLQKNIGIVDEILLADTYYEHSEIALVEAHMMALRDEAEAALIRSSSSDPIVTTPTTSPREIKFLNIEEGRVPSWSSRKISPTNAKKISSTTEKATPLSTRSANTQPPPLPKMMRFGRSDSLVLSITRGESARRLTSLTGATRVLTDRFFKV